MKLPDHECSLSITHNQHKCYYQSAEDYLREWQEDECSTEDRAACISTNEIWEIQWYPRTPVGFCIVLAATLDRALELANQEERP